MYLLSPFHNSVRCVTQDGSGNLNGLQKLERYFLKPLPPQSMRSLVARAFCWDAQNLCLAGLFHLLALHRSSACFVLWIWSKSHIILTLLQASELNLAVGEIANLSQCVSKPKSEFLTCRSFVLKPSLWNCLCREHRKSDLCKYPESTSVHWHHVRRASFEAPTRKLSCLPGNHDSSVLVFKPQFSF